MPIPPPSLSQASSPRSPRLPSPDRERAESLVWGALAVATTFAVVILFASLAQFAGRTSTWAGRVTGLRPDLVHHLLAGTTTNPPSPAGWGAIEAAGVGTAASSTSLVPRRATPAG